MSTVGGTIDHVITTNVNGRVGLPELSAAATEKFGGSPTKRAAEALVAATDPGDDVLVVTGFPAPPTNVAEVDGPVGAASLARAIKVGLQAHPTIIGPAGDEPRLAAPARAYGLQVAEIDTARDAGWSCTVDTLPREQAGAREKAAALVEAREPAAVIAVECPGPNHLGEYHMMWGKNITDIVHEPVALFEHADGVKIGIGDGGNELGMGPLRETVREVVPNAADCSDGGCECGGGIADATAADVSIPCTIADWGAYGLNAMISALVDRPTLQDAEATARALVQCGLANAVDGATGRTDGWSDGEPPSIHASVVELLREATSLDPYAEGEHPQAET